VLRTLKRMYLIGAIFLYKK